MKTAKRIWIGLAVLAILLAAAAGGAYALVRQAQRAHAAYTGLRAQLHEQLEKSSLTVTENGVEAGTFPLKRLRTDDPAAQIDALFSPDGRLSDAEFARLSWPRQLVWYAGAEKKEPCYAALHGGAPVTLALADGRWEVTPVLSALESQPRTRAQDAYAVFENGAFHVMPEQPGTELARETVEQALLECLTNVSLRADAPATRSFELTDCDCYREPGITAETAEFDYDALFAPIVDNLTLDVWLFDGTQKLPVENYVFVDDTGRAQVRTDALRARVAQMAETYDRHDTPYLVEMDPDQGRLAVPFLRCNYTLEQDALLGQLCAQLRELDLTEVTAPFSCTDLQGQPFDLGPDYIAVNIERQMVSFYRDGALAISSPVVTGMPGGHETPTGLYEVMNYEHDCWLTGPDFHVFVKYWVGFYPAYGLHDALWREEGAFGGEIYRTNGSHGCVNTPEAAMQYIYENSEVGTPVLVF